MHHKLLRWGTRLKSDTGWLRLSRHPVQTAGGSHCTSCENLFTFLCQHQAVRCDRENGRPVAGRRRSRPVGFHDSSFSSKQEPCYQRASVLFSSCSWRWNKWFCIMVKIYKKKKVAAVQTWDPAESLRYFQVWMFAVWWTDWIVLWEGVAALCKNPTSCRRETDFSFCYRDKTEQKVLDKKL